MAVPRRSGRRSAGRGSGRHRRAKAARWSLAAAGAVAAAGSLSFVGLSGSAAVAAQPPPVTATRQVNHWNVGATHSPQLLRQLKGPGAAAGTRSATATPAGTLKNAVQGIDVSSSQEGQPGGINWANARTKSGIQFAAIKATEGDYYRNSYALGDLAAAKAAGLSVAAYAFAIPNGGGSSASPVAQADDIINYLKSGPAGVPPIMLDIEYDPYNDGTNTCYGLSPAAMLTWIKSFVAEVKSKTGQPAIIYTAQGWWSTCVGTVPSPSPFAQNPLWVAAYSTGSSPGTLPSGWSSGAWTYWQYSGTGTVSGISGAVDQDQLNPGMLTLLNPGDQQDAANGAAITPVQLHSSLDASASPPTYAFSGSAPAGLSMSSSGLITGTAPASVGASSVTVTATSGAASTSATFTWYWHGTLSVTSPGTLTTAGGSPVNLQVQVSDSPAEPPVTFSAPTRAGFPADRLPGGLSMSPAGKITGWADKPGAYQVTVYAADAREAASSVTFTWTVSVAPDAGPTGLVNLDLGGVCLEDPAYSATAGTVADIRTCAAKASQEWTYAQDDSLRVHGLCLQSPGTSGSTVQLETCTGMADQQWQLADPSSVAPARYGAALTLYNPGSGMCLSDPGSATTNGTQLQAQSCGGYKGQEWTLPAGPVQSGLAGRCLDDNGNSTANRNKIDVSACTGGLSQQWAAHTDGTVRIDGRCLDVRNGGTTSGTLIDLYSCDGSSAQQWHLIADGGGVMLQNPHSGLCAADPADSTINGTQLQIRSCAASDPGMTWRIS